MHCGWRRVPVPFCARCMGKKASPSGWFDLCTCVGGLVQTVSDCLAALGDVMQQPNYIHPLGKVFFGMCASHYLG